MLGAAALSGERRLWHLALHIGLVGVDLGIMVIESRSYSLLQVDVVPVPVPAHMPVLVPVRVPSWLPGLGVGVGAGLGVGAGAGVCVGVGVGVGVPSAAPSETIVRREPLLVTSAL